MMKGRRRIVSPARVFPPRRTAPADDAAHTSLDIRQVLRPSDLTDQVMNLWSPKPAGARQFVSYWINQEHPLRYDGGKWASWDLEKAPAVMKLAQLALPNSLRHKIHLISLELARLANARFVPPRE